MKVLEHAAAAHEAARIERDRAFRRAAIILRDPLARPRALRTLAAIRRRLRAIASSCAHVQAERALYAATCRLHRIADARAIPLARAGAGT